MALGFNNKPMNQPSFLHKWSAPAPATGAAGDEGALEGAFYGTWDLNSTDLLPVPPQHADQFQRRLSAACNLNGTWLSATGDKEATIAITQVIRSCVACCLTLGFRPRDLRRSLPQQKDIG